MQVRPFGGSCLALVGAVFLTPQPCTAEAAAVSTQTEDEAEASDEAAPDEADSSDEEQARGRRFRFGVSGLIGPMAGDVGGVVGGFELRLGSQINDLFAIYAQPVFVGGAGFDASISNADVSAVGLFGIGLLPEVTLVDLIYLGAGPEYLFGVIGGAGTSGGSVDFGGLPGLAARAGLALGGSTPRRRAGFHIGLDFHAVFGENATALLPMLGLGFEMY